MKKACLILMTLVCASGLCCQPGEGPDKAANPTSPNLPRETRTQAQPPAAAAPLAVAVDRLHDDAAATMSGLAGTSDEAKAVEAAASWQAFAKAANEHWGAFDSAIFGPMKKWAGEDLRESRLVTKTLFYPFGGPDFVTALAFYPEAERTVLMGLEPVGNLPDLAKETPEWRDGFFKDFETILTDFLKRGYFVTEHMNEAFGKGRVDGALPVMLFFLKRTGNSIVSLRRLAVDAKGEWVESPYTVQRRLAKRPNGVRVDYLQAGESAPRSVYYFSCDISDAGLAKGSALYRLFDGLPGVTTFIKSGSYLLHYADFANLRNMILDRSQYVLEDDTGIPYRYFKRQGWEIQLYGAYAKPVEDFPAVVEQKDLKAAYEDPAGNVKPLPFHFGYRWVSKIDNLMLTKRPAAKLGVS
ncbi:MAG TPA: hypothetical protein VMS75_09955 [Terriglobales bacterium]|nr:hypothetical protein [Terriglobales bacterium]